ncbi:ATP-binding cassette domain-containing protein [candidate division KSB3 bacterium]|uniref:ATP-binding cassette domain-containing protein n=1 Tax=candidate division KSB3 bacterium TaxID=2044937 RepID=A0A9D5K0E4_9BACT|nr:ATP-binding cassette domain-containing protein [candidate division KSB3 bacterium]
MMMPMTMYLIPQPQMPPKGTNNTHMKTKTATTECIDIVNTNEAFSPTPPPIFQVHDLRQSYNGHLVLDIPELVLAPGKIYCFYGPNGAGKTTLFEMLTLLRTPDQGRIVFQNREAYPSDDGVAALRSQVTLVHQDPLLFDTSVERNIDYGLRLRKMNRHVRKQRVTECLQLVGLDGFQKRKARQLSGGETQRIAIARALSIHPSVLFLDEFSANIDEKHRTVLETIIRKIRETLGTTVIFTTHYLDQAYRVADEILHVFRGKLVTSPLQNLLHGTITRQGTLHRFRTDHLSLEVVTSHEGQATIAIPPNSIVISIHPLDSSMRNRLYGPIIQIIDAGECVSLKVDVGELLEVRITKKSYHEMGLHPGMSVYLSCKASAVEVF